MKWQTSAPSNIALIKYMGKDDATLNIPSNASLSYTLNDLRSTVELELSATNSDHWEALTLSSHAPTSQLLHANIHSYENEKSKSSVQQDNNELTVLDTQLSTKEQQRFLNHLSFLKKQFNCSQYFIVRSANNFPAGCGLASSASSFAALTQCALNAFKDLRCNPELSSNISVQQCAALSRRGSGSSCRSFFSPWALWRGENVESLALPYQELMHQTVVITQQKKTISSSAAHQLVTSSSLYQGRPARAEARLQHLIQCLQQQDWRTAYIICWQEFWDMHALFETATPPFGYLLPNTLAVLHFLREYWQTQQDGPIITMDAGPNIHLLFRADQIEISDKIKAELSKNYLIL